MSYLQIEKLYTSDPSLFQLWDIKDDWLDEWIVTATDDIESSLDQDSTNNKDEQIDAESKYNSSITKTTINFPEAIRNFYRVYQRPQVGDFLPPDCLGFYLPFHHSLNNYGIYILEEGVEYLTRVLFENGQGSIDIGICKKAATNFIYFHESFHHKVEMAATRWEVIVRKAVYIDSVKEVYEGGRGTDSWLEETLANVYAYEQCIQRLRKNLGTNELLALKKAIYLYIQKSPPGYRKAIEMINVYGKPEKSFQDSKNLFYEFLQELFMPDTKAYSNDVWNFGFFDYPLNKVNGRIHFLVPKNSSISKRISLNGRLLSSKILIKKLTKSFAVEKVREGKGSHSIWQTKSGKSTTIPKNKDLPIGTLSKIIKDLELECSVYEFLNS